MRREKSHAKKLGSAFDHALEIATMVVRSNNKLVGLDKIRAEIAWRAALKATGYPGANPLSVPVHTGDDTQEIIDELFEKAVNAARAARDVVLRSSLKDPPIQGMRKMV